MFIKLWKVPEIEITLEYFSTEAGSIGSLLKYLSETAFWKTSREAYKRTLKGLHMDILLESFQKNCYTLF